MKIVIGVVTGAVVAFLCIYGIEIVGHTVYPLPAAIDLGDPAQVERLMATMPAGAFAFVLVGWFAGALAGAWVADAIAKRGLAGWIVALLVIAGGVATMIVIPHPLWMWAAGIGLPLVAAWLAQKLAKVPA
jgi:hypothetical protein